MEDRQTAESLVSESRSLLKQAEKYREDLDNLPKDDATREQKKHHILELLEQSQKLSQLAKTVVSNDRPGFKSYFIKKS